MELLSPQKIVLPDRLPIATSEFPFEYRENGLDIVQHGRLPKLFIGTDVIPRGGSASVEIAHYPPSQETVMSFLQMQRLVNTCINNAEDIKREFHRIVAFIFRKKLDQARASNTYDFMKLKDTFTDYMKKDAKTRHLANKAFRRVLNQFVIDRNTYTHGKLVIRHGDNAFVIVYQDNSTKITTYAIINTQIIESYFNAYKLIRKLVSDFYSLADTTT